VKAAIDEFQAITTHCEICVGRSTWDFLQDFYLRVDIAENYARRLEKDLHDAQTAIHQYQSALAEYAASLAASWETLNGERLEHQACREALTFETERHKETIELLDRIFKEAMRSVEVADFLSSRRETAPKLEACQAVPKLEGPLTETPLTRKKLIEPGTFTSMGQQGESTQRRQMSVPATSHQLGKHERQTATLVCSTEISDNPQPNCASSAYGFPPTITRSQKAPGGTGSVQAQNGKLESSLRTFQGTT
jgi:hypothetical protein